MTTEVPASSTVRACLRLLVVVAVGAFVADLVTKVAVVASLRDGERIPLLGDAVALTLVRDAVSAGLILVLVVVAAAVVVAIVRSARRLGSSGWAVALALVLAGAVGDLVDRIVLGNVTDILSIGGWPGVNLAHVSIGVGVLLMVVLALSGRRLDGTARGDAGPDDRGLATPDHPDADIDPDDPDELDPDDEKVALVDRPRYPANKWEQFGSDSDDEDVIDEDDRPAASRPRHPANKWEQ